MTEVRVLKVFVGPDGRGGNPLGVVLDGGRVEPRRRQVRPSPDETVEVGGRVEAIGTREIADAVAGGVA